MSLLLLDVAVRTNSGTVWGRAKEYVGQNQEVAGEYYSFRGIPYAEPPVGELIWRDPVPVSYQTWGNEVTFLVINDCFYKICSG